ncbi:hypothetical protein ABIA30_003871 [Mycobacterium sp. MAA66]|uniref:hypothetical protein n=1 Tax=Mycobacterium sp. MAA66 TaxID=3156297 RepID=UPI0035118DD9
MQLALRPWSADADLMAAPVSNGRTNKILIGTVAALSASVIAAGPAVQHSATLEVHQAQQRAVQLVAAVTDSPIAVYGDLVNHTVHNVGTLLKQYAASPFPILGAIVENQVGYLKQIFDFSAASTAFKTWWENGTRESAPGKTLLANVQSALSKGNLGVAYENFNKLALFGLQNTVLTWANGWLFSTSTTMGIPQRMAQNLSNALGAFFTTGTLVFGAFQAAYAPFSGAAFELSRSLGAVGSAVGAGNLAGAITALVNTPGAVADAFLNGFAYSGSTNPWAGLFSPKDPACTGRCASGGPISQFLITIAQKIAAAIKNVPAKTATTTAAVAVSDPAASLVSATLEPAATSYTLSLGSGSSTSTATDHTVVAAAAATTDKAAAADTTAAAPATSKSDAAKTEDIAKAEVTTKAQDTAKAPATATATDTGKPADTASSTGTAAAGTSTTDSPAKAGSDNVGSDKAGSDKAGSVKAGSDKVDGANGGSAQGDSAKSGSVKNRSTKHGSGKTGSADGQSDSAKTGSAKGASAKADPAKGGSAKGGSARHDSGKQGSAKHAAKHDSGSAS